MERLYLMSLKGGTFDNFKVDLFKCGLDEDAFRTFSEYVDDLMKFAWDYGYWIYWNRWRD